MIGIKRSTSLAALAALALIPLGLAGCPEKGPAEKAGETVDEAMEDAGDAMKDAGDEIEDALD